MTNHLAVTPASKIGHVKCNCGIWRLQKCLCLFTLRRCSVPGNGRTNLKFVDLGPSRATGARYCTSLLLAMVACGVHEVLCLSEHSAG